MTLAVSSIHPQEFINALTGFPLPAIFTAAGASALYDYYSDLSDQTGEEFYIDRDAIFRQWTEWSIDDLHELIIQSGYYSRYGYTVREVEEWLSVHREHHIRYEVTTFIESSAFSSTFFVFTRN